MLAYLTLALELTSNPIALAGCIGLGVYATTNWRAFKYAVLWGLAVQIFAVALGRVSFLDLEGLIAQTCLRLTGALIVTMGVFYLYRFMRRGYATAAAQTAPSAPGQVASEPIRVTRPSSE